MHKSSRHLINIAAALILCLGLVPPVAWAQQYPSKSIRIVVGLVAGGAVDFTARLVAQKLSDDLGQTVLVENRPGAGGTIAIAGVATSPADGYTLLMMGASGAVQSALRPKLPYDLVRDLAPVSLVASGVMVLVVHPSLPAQNVNELIALARKQQGKLSFGSAGVGSAAHLAGELLNTMAKVNIVHVPYKGGAASATATAGGEIEMAITDFSAVLPFLESKRLRPLAITSGKRVSLLPDLPTLDEAGLNGYDRSTWFGVLAPAAVPKEIIARLNAALSKSFNTPDVADVLRKQGLVPQTSTPEQFATLIRNEIATNIKLVKSSGAKPE